MMAKQNLNESHTKTLRSWMAVVPYVVSAVATATCFYFERQRRKKRQAEQRQQGVKATRNEKSKDATLCYDNNQNDDIVLVPLLPFEQLSVMRNEDPITTVTWFAGNYQDVKEQLIHRAWEILHQNTWLYGRLVKQRNRKWCLRYYKKIPITTTLADSSLTPLFIIDTSRSPLQRDISVEELVPAVSTFLQSQQPNDIGDHDTLFWKVYLIPCRRSPQSHFALVVSLSHVIGDGDTFYQLYRCLVSSLLTSTNDTRKNNNSNNNRIISLQVDRIATSEQQQINALGYREYHLPTSIPYMLNAMAGIFYTTVIAPLLLRKDAMRTVYLQVNADRIDQVKRDAANEDDVVSYCSTNDVLASWFFTTTGSNFGLMVVNFRNKLLGHTAHHAGNYERFLFYQLPADAATPALIRRSLFTLRRCVTENSWPTFGLILLGLYSNMTNVSSLAMPKEVDDGVQSNEGGSGAVREEWHVPVYTTILPGTCTLMIIFRAGVYGPNRNRLGVCIIGTDRVLTRLEQNLPSFLTTDPLLS